MVRCLLDPVFVFRRIEVKLEQFLRDLCRSVRTFQSEVIFLLDMLGFGVIDLFLFQGTIFPSKERRASCCPSHAGRCSFWAQSISTRSGSSCCGVGPQGILGRFPHQDVVERFWRKVRQRCARFVRKTLSFSKCPLDPPGSRREHEGIRQGCSYWVGKWCKVPESLEDGGRASQRKRFHNMWLRLPTKAPCGCARSGSSASWPGRSCRNGIWLRHDGESRPYVVAVPLAGESGYEIRPDDISRSFGHNAREKIPKPKVARRWGRAIQSFWRGRHGTR
jgi:hypothetical protein